MTVNYNGGGRNNHRNRSRRSKVDVTGTPSFSATNTRAVNARIASFRHTAAPRAPKAVRSERPFINFAFAQPEYALSVEGRKRAEPSWTEREEEEEIEVDEDDSPLAELSFETQRRLLLDQPDWTSLPHDRRSSSSLKKPSYGRKSAIKSSICRNPRPLPIELEPPTLPPLRDTYLRGSSVFEGNSTTASLGTFPRSTPPRLPSPSSPFSASGQPTQPSPSGAGDRPARVTPSNLASLTRPQASLSSNLGGPSHRSGSITSEASADGIVGLVEPAPAKHLPHVSSPKWPLTARHAGHKQGPHQTEQSAEDELHGLDEDEQEILPFPSSPVAKQEEASLDAGPSSECDLPSAVSPLPALPTDTERSTQPAPPSHVSAPSANFRSLAFPNSYLAALAQTMDIPDYPASDWPSQPASPTPAHPSIACPFSPEPSLEDDLTFSILSGRSNFVSERMGLGCTSISKEQAVELLLRERLLRRGAVEVASDASEAEEEKGKVSEHGETSKGGEEAMGGGEPDPLASQGPSGQTLHFAACSTLTAIGNLSSSSRSTQPFSFDLKSSLEAAVGSVTGGGEEGVDRKGVRPCAALPAFFSSGSGSSLSQDRLASQRY